MKYCTHCGKQLLDEAVLCPGCGCAANNIENANIFNSQICSQLLNQLSSKLKTNGIIWLIIGIIQVFIGLFINWFALIVGILNIVSSVKDINYSSTILNEPKDIIKNFEPVTGPIITLVYNLIFGGVIGVVGSIYYFVAVRSLVTEHKHEFEAIEKELNL